MTPGTNLISILLKMNLINHALDRPLDWEGTVYIEPNHPNFQNNCMDINLKRCLIWTLASWSSTIWWSSHHLLYRIFTNLTGYIFSFTLLKKNFFYFSIKCLNATLTREQNMCENRKGHYV